MAKERFFYITTDDPKENKFLIFSSDKFKLTNQELLNLIKVCLKERRAVDIGRRLFDAWEFIAKEIYSEKEIGEQLARIGMEQKKKNGTEFIKSKSKDKKI
jgi:hypothetical protein